MTRLTLTFDNGPDPTVTPQVLDALRARQVRAHFFVLGKHVATEAGRQLVARAIEEGHLIGNHSYTHAVPLGEDARGDAVEREISATERALDEGIGAGRGEVDGATDRAGDGAGGGARGAKRFRPFGGGGVLGPHLLSRRAVAHLIEHRYTCVLWSSVPRDWEDVEGWPARALAECAAQEHAVLVLHDVAGACGARLAEFLDEVRRRGIELTTELPRACTPIVDGVVVGELAGLVAPE